MTRLSTCCTESTIPCGDTLWVTMRRTAETVASHKMSLRTLDLDSFQCHKWIAVGDIYLDFELMPYNQYNFNDLYIVENSGDNDGIFCVL